MKKKFNILMVIETSGPGGAETVLQNIAANLDKDLFNSSVVLHRPGWFQNHLIKNNIKTTVIHSRRAWDISFVYRLIRHCKTNRIDLIHSHLPGANLYSCLAGVVLRIPIIATFHNELILPGRSHNYSSIKHFLTRNMASRVIIIAKFMADDFIAKAKFPAEKMMTIYNGIQFRKPGNSEVSTRLKSEIGIGENDLVVGNVANIRPPKGHLFLIEAAGIACKKLPNLKILLIGEEGDGKLKSEIVARIDALGISNNVKMLGFRSDITELLGVFDIFALSSISEGLPLSVVEAMSASLPVVATNVGGLPEIITDGGTGFLVPPSNAAALAEKILILARDKALRIKIGERGRDFVQKAFSIDKMINSYQNLYRELLL